MQSDINKWLKKANAAKLRNNHKECAEAFNEVGATYQEISSYEEAIHYHEKALEIFRAIGDRLGTAITHRAIGECKLSCTDHAAAIIHINKYLELAERCNNKLEVQRAWTTLGRVFLSQAQDMKDNRHVIDENIKGAAREADKRFYQALKLAESLREGIDAKEYAKMRAGLLLNIGLVKDILGDLEDSVSKFAQAIEIYKAAKLKDDLFRAQIIVVGIYKQRNEIRLAAKICESALETARSVGKKILICEGLIENGLIRMLQRDFKSAKKMLARAYLEKSPNEEDRAKAIKLTKLAHLISTNFDKMSQHDVASETRYKLCDKLGDLFVAVGLYKLAIEYYKRAYTDAKVCGKPKLELARILYSIAESYADEGQFEHALACYDKELTYREGCPQEQCATLLKMAQIHEKIQSEPRIICAVYERALEKAGKDPVLLYRVLKEYVPFSKSAKASHLSVAKKGTLATTFVNLKAYPEVLEESIRDEEQQQEQLPPATTTTAEELEDEVSDIDDLISDDEEDEEVMIIGRRRVRGGNKKFKADELGNTPLHEACIKGDLKRVKLLINQGHEVNPKDNAGWIPLHEACNHGYYEVAEFLIEHGADVSNRGPEGFSPLHDCATNGHFEIMRLLIKNGANVIALTDSGETVLSCLRGYKQRSSASMSNREIGEYKQMEAELMNHMDKCGYNLMQENSSKSSSSSATTTTTTTNNNNTRKNDSSTRHNNQRPSGSSASASILNAISGAQTTSNSDPKPSTSRGGHSLSNSRQHHRHHLGERSTTPPSPIRSPCFRTLPPPLAKYSDSYKPNNNPSTTNKTSRPQTSGGAHKKQKKDLASQPSTAKKTILISDDEDNDDDDGDEDDDNDDDLIYYRRHNVSLDNNTKDNRDHHQTIRDRPTRIDDDDDEEDEIEIMKEISNKDKTTNNDKENSYGGRYYSTNYRDDDITANNLRLHSPVPPLLYPPSPVGIPSPMYAPLNGDDDEFSSEMEVPSQPSSSSVIFTNAISANKNSSSSAALAPTTTKQQKQQQATFDIFQEPLSVQIQGRKLLIPIKEKSLTIKKLKEMIVQRYSVLVDDANPVISLSPSTEPDCDLFDGDLCCDVIRSQELIAKVVSWQLEELWKGYESSCAKWNITPLRQVTFEMKRIQTVGGGNKLDLSFVHLPECQVLPVTLALTHRDFTNVDLTGARRLFTPHKQSVLSSGALDQERATYTALSSWQRMTQLNLSCVGLVRAQFETLCSELKLNELRKLNLSFNAIHYKCKSDFVVQVKLLLENCPKLLRLDFKKNFLTFIKPMLTSGSTTTPPPAAAGAGELNTGDMQLNLVDLLLDLCDGGKEFRKNLEIYCPAQATTEIYSTADN